MIKINENFLALPGDYLFAEVARRAARQEAAHPDKRLIRLGIGDVTLPLPRACVEAMKSAAEEQADAETFRGYGPYDGYGFLREAIVQNEYAPLGCNIAPGEIFVSDGAKSDCGNIGDIFSAECTVAVCDPVYPVYIDANVLAGRAGKYADGKWSRIAYMPCTAENGFIPKPEDLPAGNRDAAPDLIYLCSPNNPTGAAATKEELALWVDYANMHGSVILFDAAYRDFITESGLPRSIYEIPGAETCAIEFCSFSKKAGFTGTRCGWTVVPHALERGGARLYDLWMRRQATKYNGTSYIIQRGAEAVYSEEGAREVRGHIGAYLNNARVIREGLVSAGLEVYGGVNSPYIWFRAPGGLGSWEFFDRLLEEANVVTTPGAGFGPSGEGFIRVTAFGRMEDSVEAISRIKSIL